MKFLKVLAIILLAAVGTVAQQGQNSNGSPQNCDNQQKSKGCIAKFNGRWEFADTTGDSLYQLSTWGQSGVDTYLTQTGNVIAIDTVNTFLYTGADQYGVGANGSGTVSGNTITLTFSKPANANGYIGQPAFYITYVGDLSVGKNPDHTPLITITGTYTTNQTSTWSNGSGNFTATWFPNWTTATTYSGSLDALDSQGNLTGQTYPVTYTVQNSPNSDLITGTVNAVSLIKNGVSCFVNQPLQIFQYAPGTLMGGSFASGEFVEIYAKDSTGNYIFMEGTSVSDNGGPAGVNESWIYPSPATGTGPFGTNKTYAFLFSVHGGPCDGWEGTDNPFTVINHHQNGTNQNGSNQNGSRHHGQNHN